MNISSIYAKSSDKVQNSANKSSGNALASYKKGQVIEGIISKVSDKISINFSGREIKFPKSTVRDAKEGEIRKFEITDISEKSIVLKEVGDSTKSSGAVNAVSTTVETNQITFTEHLEKSAEEKAAEEAKVKEDEDTKNSLEDTSNRMTEDDYSNLEAEGDLGSYELEQLEQALERIKAERVFKEEHVASQVVKNEEYREQVDNIAQSTGIGNAMAEKIVEKLLAAGLPITDDNVEKLASAMSQTAIIGNMSDQSMNYIIDNGLEPSIENIYKGEYSGNPQYAKPVDEQTWNELLEKVKEIITDAGLEVGEESLGNAKWLIDQGLPITKENLLLMNSLKQIKESAGTPESQDMILEKLVEALSEGKDPKSASLDSTTLKQVEQFIEDLNNIQDEAIDYVVKQQQEVNIKNLKEAGEDQKDGSGNQGNNNHTTAWERNAAAEYAAANDVDIATITARRQLEEIRLRMTIDTARSLQSKGIDLNTTQLVNIVEELKALEDDYYKNIFRELDVEETADHLNLLRETTEKVNDLKAVPNYIIGSRLTGFSIDTINELHSRGSALKVQLDKAETAYDTLMTAPNKEYGDSIKKAFESVDPMLEDMNLEKTDANRRAVRILGYNGIEVTEENIQSMKSYDAKVNNLIDNLHPAVTLRLIKDGINPLDTPIDELNQQVMDLKEEIGVTDEEKYSKYLWKLEQKNGITEEERKSYIGIYRLLNNVEKSDGAAIGAVVNAEQELTLKNLLTAVRTIKSGGIDGNVNDDFGALEDLHFSKESITDQIGAGYAQESGGTIYNTGDEKLDYYNQTVSNILDTITPEKLGALSENGDVLDNSIEMFYEKLTGEAENAETDTLYYKEKVNQFRELSENSEDAIRLLNRHEIPVTMGNLASANLVESRSNHLFKEMNRQLGITKEDSQAGTDIKAAVEGFEDALTDSASMAEQYDKLEKAVTGAINKEYQDNKITSKHLSALRNINSGMELVKNLSRNEHYEIPILTGDEVTNIKLTIVHGANDKGKVSMSVESEQFGSITADFTVKNNEVKGLILCEDRAGMEFLKESAADLEEVINQTGLGLNQLNFGIGHTASYSYSGGADNKSVEDNDTVNTEQLYRVAKAFVQQVKALERI